MGPDATRPFVRIFLYRNSKSRAMAARLFTFRDQELAGGRPGVAHAVQPSGIRFSMPPGDVTGGHRPGGQDARHGPL